MKVLGILTTIIGIVTCMSAAITRDEARSAFWGSSYAYRDIIADAEITMTIGIVVAVVGILLLLAFYITSQNNKNNQISTRVVTKKCLNCGNVVNANQKFCGKCGNNLER